MSVSAKNMLNMTKILKNNKDVLFNIPKRETSTEKIGRHLSLKNAFYKTNEKTKTKTDLTILNYITKNSEGRFSAKTSLSDSAPEKLEYDLCMVNKYDENLNTSLSFISEFDLEEDGEKQNDSFNSCDEDSCIEEIEIKTKSNKRNLDDIENEEFNSELEKDWDDIQNILLKNKSSQ